jgi:hypothetical protein
VTANSIITMRLIIYSTPVTGGVPLAAGTFAILS